MIAPPPRWWSGRIVLLLAACLSIGLVPSSHAQPPKPVQALHRPPFPPFEIVGLAGDAFLVWGDAGRMQIRTSAGVWTGVFRVPFHQVDDVVADGQGILVGGFLDSRASAVLFLDQTGQERGRWLLAHPFYAFRVGDGARLAATWDGIVPLLPGGVVGALRPYRGAEIHLPIPPNLPNLPSYCATNHRRW